jgi:hypothetical protein
MSNSFQQVSFLFHAVSLLPTHLCNHILLKIDKTIVTARDDLEVQGTQLSTDDRKDKKLVLKKAKIMFQGL